jgi:hypothetical protein
MVCDNHSLVINGFKKRNTDLSAEVKMKRVKTSIKAIAKKFNVGKTQFYKR